MKKLKAINMKKLKTLNMKKVALIVGIVVGVLSIYFGNEVLDFNRLGTSISSTTSFGGDFYTYSYEASVAIANNTKIIIRILSKGLGYFLIVFGLSDIALFSYLYAINEKEMGATAEAKTEDLAQPTSTADAPEDGKTKSAIEMAEEIDKYKKLRDSDMITEEEFQARKAKILGL